MNSCLIIRQMVILLALLLSLIGSAAVLADDALPIEPFEARYTVSAIGFPVGEAVVTLTDLKQGRYRMALEAKPNDVAEILLPAELSIQASGQISNGIVRPQRYEEKVTGMDVDTTRLKFDWDAGELRAQSGSEQATLPLSPGVLDPLSMTLVAMRDLRRGQRMGEYSLAKETEIKKYRIKVDGEESISTALGDLRTIRINERKSDGSRVTSFWFAPDLDYLLVQAVQLRKGFETVRLAIKEARYVR